MRRLLDSTYRTDNNQHRESIREGDSVLKPIAFALFRILLLIAAAMLANTAATLANATSAQCTAPSPLTTSVPYNPFGVTVPWAKTSAPGIDLYVGLTNGLDAPTQNRLTQQAQSTGTGTLVLFLIDVSAPTGFPKLSGHGTTGSFTWPFSRRDKVVEKNGHRFYPLALTLNAGCWNISAQFAGATTQVLTASVP